MINNILNSSTYSSNILSQSQSTYSEVKIFNRPFSDGLNNYPLEHVRYSPNVTFQQSIFTTSNQKYLLGVQSPSEYNDQNNIKEKEIFKITVLPTKTLKEDIDAIIESDDEGYIIRTLNLPLYGYGDDPFEAIQNIKYEIESLFNDLMEDDNFSDEWLRYKNYLNKIISTE